MLIPGSRLQRQQIKAEPSFERFTMGDSVLLLPGKNNAIVFQPADGEGNVVIQLQGQKIAVRHNRLKLLVPAAQLYRITIFPSSLTLWPTAKPRTPWRANMTQTPWSF